jgi:thiamine-phosphate pyrophosphorylase
MFRDAQKDPLVIAITLPEIIDGEHLAIVSLLKNGVSYVHVRKPNATAKEIEGYLNQFDNSIHDRITLHGHEQLALEYGLGGIHTKNDITQYSNNLKRFSKSCHSIAEVTECPAQYEYVFLSPIFDSISKQGYISTLNHHKLNQFLKHKNPKSPKVIALGGLDEQTVPKAKMMGFDGFALLGGLWSGEKNIDIEKTLMNLTKSISAWKDQ